MEALVNQHERRLNSINGHIERLASRIETMNVNQNRLAGGLAALVAIANVALAIYLKS